MTSGRKYVDSPNVLYFDPVYAFGKIQRVGSIAIDIDTSDFLSGSVINGDPPLNALGEENIFIKNLSKTSIKKSSPAFTREDLSY